MRLGPSYSVALTLLLGTGSILAQHGAAFEGQSERRPGQSPSRLPEGNDGIAAKHLGDAGIEEHSEVVTCLRRRDLVGGQFRSLLLVQGKRGP